MASSLVAALPSAASRLSIRRRLRVNARDRKSTRLNSSHTVIYTLSLHDALPIFGGLLIDLLHGLVVGRSLALGGEQAVHQKTAARERQAPLEVFGILDLLLLGGLGDDSQVDQEGQHIVLLGR